MNDDFYNSAEARLDTVAGKHAFWTSLRSAYSEFKELSAYNSDGPVLSIFKDYMCDTYGVGINSDTDGNILPTHTILDEQKYLIFLLKHSKHEN